MDKKEGPSKIRLPHPYLTTYYLEPSPNTVDPSYRFRQEEPAEAAQGLPQPLLNDQLRFSSFGSDNTDTLEEHRDYLRAMHDDAHVMAVLGRFGDAPFAYFELYWAKEDKMGAHYAALDFDRGRHSLVGDTAFRGLHRVMTWWPSVMHFLFLDDHRTENVVGEPRLSNDKVLMYEYMFGLHQDKYLDLPHKRSSLVKCSRERFFQLCPFGQDTRHVAGTGFGFQPRL